MVMEQTVERITLSSRFRSNDIWNTLILKFESGLRYKESFWEREQKNKWSNLNVGDIVLATVTQDNIIINVNTNPKVPKASL